MRSPKRLGFVSGKALAAGPVKFTHTSSVSGKALAAGPVKFTHTSSVSGKALAAGPVKFTHSCSVSGKALAAGIYQQKLGAEPAASALPLTYQRLAAHIPRCSTNLSPRSCHPLGLAG